MRPWIYSKIVCWHGRSTATYTTAPQSFCGLRLRSIVLLDKTAGGRQKIDDDDLCFVARSLDASDDAMGYGASVALSVRDDPTTFTIEFLQTMRRALSWLYHV